MAEQSLRSVLMSRANYHMTVLSVHALNGLFAFNRLYNRQEVRPGQPPPTHHSHHHQHHYTHKYTHQHAGSFNNTRDTFSILYSQSVRYRQYYIHNVCHYLGHQCVAQSEMKLTISLC